MNLESLVDVGAVTPGDEIEAPEWVKKPADEPPIASENEIFSWNRPASRGGDVYPGREKPSGTVIWADTNQPEREYPVVRNCSWDEDAYVKHEVEVTRMQMESGAIRGSFRDADGKIVDDRKARLERSERYARWRYRGFLAGQVSSL